MVEVRPFKAIRYTQKPGDIAKLITQPYDKITPEMQKKYYAQSEHNYCRLILPIEENRYDIAKERTGNWLNDAALAQDSTPAIYVYFQDFEVLGAKHTRKGFVGAVKLTPFVEKVVLPHEKTHAGPKVDRLKMYQATQKNLEMGFMLYPDPKKEILALLDDASKGVPIIDVVDEYNVRNRLWRMDNPAKTRMLGDALKGEQVVIADGHHRYETGVSFRDEMRAANPGAPADSAFNFSMTLMVAVDDKGLVVLPGHRALLKDGLTGAHLKKAAEYFDLKELKRAEVDAYLKKNRDAICFVAYDGKLFTGMTMKRKGAVDKFLKPEYSPDYKGLDVVVLRDAVFEALLGLKDLKIHETIDYFRWADDAIKAVDDGQAKVAFLLNATRPEQVLKCAKNGERMPEKSTDFYPKMVSGVTMMDIQPGETL
ncbi:MAG: DUF1015 domain-containing protein [Methanobacteriota archaeon]